MLYGVILSTRRHGLAREPVVGFCYFTLQPTVVSKERFWLIMFFRSSSQRLFVVVEQRANNFYFKFANRCANSPNSWNSSCKWNCISYVCWMIRGFMCASLQILVLYVCVHTHIHTHTHTHTHTQNSKDLDSLAGPLLCLTVVSIYDNEQTLAEINRSERYLCSTVIEQDLTDGAASYVG